MAIVPFNLIFPRLKAYLNTYCYTASPGVKKCSASLEKHSERLLHKCDLSVFKQNTIWGIQYYLDIIIRM